MQTINKEFYAQVLSDYQAANELWHEPYICNTSDLFNAAWILDSSRAKIKEHAAKFIQEYKLKDVSVFSEEDGIFSRTLFYNVSTMSSRDLRDVFLEWATNNVNE